MKRLNSKTHFSSFHEVNIHIYVHGTSQIDVNLGTRPIFVGSDLLLIPMCAAYTCQIVYTMVENI